MNDAPVDVGIVSNSGNRRDADPRRSAPDLRHRRVPRPHLEREMVDASIGYSRIDIDNTDAPGAERVQDRPVRARQSALHARAERDDGRRVPVGRTARISRTASASTTISVQFSFKYSFSAQGRRLVMMRTTSRSIASTAGSPLAVAARAAGGRAAHRRQPIRRRRVNAAFDEVQDSQGGQERRLHSGARQGGSEPVRHRAGDRGRQGLHGRRHQDRGVDPVDLQGLHDGAGRSRSRAPSRSRNASASMRPAHGSTRSSPSKAVKTVVGTGAPEMNPLVNPGAISATSMVKGANADAVWKKIIGIYNDVAGRPLTRAAGRLQVRVRHQPAQPGDRRADATPTATSRPTGSRPSISTRGSARSA